MNLGPEISLGVGDDDRGASDIASRLLTTIWDLAIMSHPKPKPKGEMIPAPAMIISRVDDKVFLEYWHLKTRVLGEK